MSTYEDQAAQVGRSAHEVAHTAREAGADVVHAVKEDATQIADTARAAGADVAHTAKDEATRAAHEAATQARGVTADVKQRVRDELDRQHRGVADRVGAFAEELYTMAGEHPQTPAKELVGMLAKRSSAFAQYLEQRGPEAALAELQDFARRKPGTFLVAAVAAGFVIGRLGKGLWQNQRDGSGS